MKSGRSEKRLKAVTILDIETVGEIVRRTETMEKERVRIFGNKRGQSSRHLGHQGSDYKDVKFTVKTKKVKALDVKR